MSTVVLLVALAATTADAAPDEETGPAPDTVLALPQHAEPPRAGDDDVEARLRAFSGTALRMEPTNGLVRLDEDAPWWSPSNISERAAFRVWTPDGTPLNRASALRRAGADELADRQELVYQMLTLEMPLLVATLTLSIGGLLGGLGGIAVLAALGLVPLTVPLLVAATLAVGIATVVPVFAFALAELVPTLIAVDDEEARRAIATHNKGVARTHGIPEDGLPFAYIGY